jgi:L-lactate dehydrogenase complex protein LldF
VERAGGKVHWCSTAEDARAAILKICRDAGARTVTKGKSMISEEIGSTPTWRRTASLPVETDLGEYILQLRREHPSHIIAPAFHLNREDWEADFRRSHTDLPRTASSPSGATSCRRRAASCATASWPPTSASPAPTS